MPAGTMRNWNTRRRCARKIRDEMQKALLESEPARASRDKLCQYISEHHLRDSARDLGQYVSLAMYLSPPPELTPSADVTELPPDSAAVVNVLPLVRAFADEVQLHAIWARHRAEYDALLAKVHEPMTQMILDTNIYLHQPVSSYDGRRFLVLLEPMLSPNVTHARIYATDYIVVMSPSPEQKDGVNLEPIRHTYLHYVVEPMVYSRASAMERLLPLLRPVQDAPLEFQYKSDIVALLAECLIKALKRGRTKCPAPKPAKPKEQRRASDDGAVRRSDDGVQPADGAGAAEADRTGHAAGLGADGYFFDKLMRWRRTAMVCAMKSGR